MASKKENNLEKEKLLAEIERKGNNSIHIIDQWAGKDGNCCRILVGMQRLPEKELRAT